VQFPDPENLKDLFDRAEGLMYTIADAVVANTNDASGVVTKQNNDWFSGIANYMETVLKDATVDFHEDRRIAWVEVEGVPFKVWTDNTFKRIAARWGNLLDVDDHEDKCFHSKRLCIHTKMDRSILEDFKIIYRGTIHWIRAKETRGWVPDFVEESSDDEQEDGNVNDEELNKDDHNLFGEDEDIEGINRNEGGESVKVDGKLDEGEFSENKEQSADPFEIYPLLNKKVEGEKSGSESNGSLKYPPGFTPEESKVNNSGNDMEENLRDDDVMRPINSHKEPSHSNFQMEHTDSVSSGHFKISEAPRTGGSILGLLEGVVRVGHVMGYKMEGCKIREWKASHKTVGQVEITELKRNLARIDDVIDSGNGNGDVISERVDILSKLHDIENIQASEIAQKYKVKWAVEGDENSGFFHGILNKKRSILNIECDVTNEEIKRAVWECGTDKAPGPDGFTFGFFRRFWELLECDVTKAVSNINTLVYVLDCFHKASGLRINMRKSNSLWASIIKEMKSLSAKGLDLLKFMRIKVGNGSSTSFWVDKWCIEGVLKDRFPRMYALELDKNVTVADKLSQLAPINDRWIWELENTGDFTVASARKAIDDKFLPSVLCKTIWNKFVPRKINVHAWKVKMDAFPTRFNMSRRGISINSILRGNCDVEAETTSHLFFSCQMARDVSKHIARWWSVPEYEFGTYDEWSSWFAEVHLPAMNKSMFEGVFYVAWWLLWWFRNKEIFEEKVPKKELFLDDVKYEDRTVLFNDRLCSWKVILNGDSLPLTRSVEDVKTPYPPTTVEEKLARKNELKARGTLLMALLNKHQLKFNSYKNAKSLMEAIEKRFGEGLDQIYNMLQKLISQIKIYEETISQEDLNLKLLKSLPSEWKTHTLVWRNKSDLETLSMDDLYNNLKIYEAEVMGLSSTTQNIQNVAFVSSNNTDNTNKIVNPAYDVSAANSKTNASNLSNVDSLSDAVIYSFFASQSNSPQLDNKDLKQIDLDDLELSQKRLFCQECMYTKHQNNRNREAPRRTMPVEDTTSNALVSQSDGLGYDWSGHAEDGLTNFSLMAYTFSSSSSSDTEFNLGAYKASLESVETRLDVYKKNKTIFIDDIKILKLDVMLRDKAITELRQKFEKAEKEKDDLKLTLEKFQDSSKNLSRLLDSQQSDKSKTDLGYDSQGADNQVLENRVNDKTNTSEGYHAVSPPYTGNFMPPKPNLVFADEHVVSESITSLPDIAKNKVKTSEKTLKNVSAPIIED
nr:RNA-directed DNA polymerase, eukaryota [Tanacetum cinerariifolium]